jgi:hypothetical protein
MKLRPAKTGRFFLPEWVHALLPAFRNMATMRRL